MQMHWWLTCRVTTLGTSEEVIQQWRDMGCPNFQAARPPEVIPGQVLGVQTTDQSNILRFSVKVGYQIQGEYRTPLKTFPASLPKNIHYLGRSLMRVSSAASKLSECMGAIPLIRLNQINSPDRAIVCLAEWSWSMMTYLAHMMTSPFLMYNSLVQDS
jgi:hypothetical protein